MEPGFVVGALGTLIVLLVGVGLSSLLARRAQARADEMAADRDRAEARLQSEQVKNLMANWRLRSETEERTEHRPAEAEAPAHGPTDASVEDPLALSDALTVTHIQGFTLAEVGDEVRKALDEKDRRDRASREAERKQDRKFQIWLAVGAFLAGSVVTLLVTWIFAAIAGAL